MTTNRNVPNVLLFGLLVMAMLVGCGGDEQQPPAPMAQEGARTAPLAEDSDREAAETAPADETAPPVTEGDAQPAQQLRRTVAMPADYPPDAPVYPGTEPSQVMKGADGRMVVMFGTPDSPEQVMDYMTGHLPSTGWEVLGQQELPTGMLLQATKGDRLLSVVLSRLDDGLDSAITMIAISVDS